MPAAPADSLFGGAWVGSIDRFAFAAYSEKTFYPYQTAYEGRCPERNLGPLLAGHPRQSLGLVISITARSAARNEEW